MFLLRALLVWLVIIGVETVHGILRTLVLLPAVGDFRARQISVFTGSVLIFGVAYVFIEWIQAKNRKELIVVGLMWVLLTVIFEVVMILRKYGIKPRGQQWQATWLWAHAISDSYFYPHWPTALEISTQYVLLLLSEIKESDGLKLPYRAGSVIPAEVRALLPSNPVPLLIHEPVINGSE